MATHRHTTHQIIDQNFLNDVLEGLSQKPKRLYSKYFYNEVGDRLFQEIMQLEEYYLSRAELDILSNQAEEMLNALSLVKNEPFHIIELGAGDGSKTLHFLRHLVEEKFDFNYMPFDISAAVLKQLEEGMHAQIPSLQFDGIAGDYHQNYQKIKAIEGKKIIFFLGSNLGNFSDEEAHAFLKKIGDQLAEGDKLFIGLDEKKSTDIVLPAYHDSKGVTKAFNLNLLQRINDELDGNFRLENFEHTPEYDEESGFAKSYLSSLIDQEVTIDGKAFSFFAGEKILMEISRKYDENILSQIIKNTAFSIHAKLQDSKKLFSNYILNVS